MSGKIEVSQEYFVKHLVERLKAITEKLMEVDEVLYEKKGFDKSWNNVRSSLNELGEITDALE